MSLPKPLPPGFGAPGDLRAPTGPETLDVRPLARVIVARLHRAPFPPDDVKQYATAVADQPVAPTVHPLLVSADRLRPGQTFDVAAGFFPKSTHPVLFVLEGPQRRAQRLVQAVNGAAAATVHLPDNLVPGTWVIAVVDLSQLVTQPSGGVGGAISMSLGVLTVAP